MMMPTMSDGTKLDLSRLTDEEARHVWQVIQRDFNLRKKEEERLGDLKSKIVKEDTKRELLGYQSNLSDSLCIHCLQPFKFLLNTKHQCLDCKLFVCKVCSRFNKKEHGWVCEPCQKARLLKIGTLEWFHENVRSRFKRFGSAKVLKSLYKRLNEEQTCFQTDLREDDTYCMPDVHSNSLCSQEDEHSENLGREHYRLTKTGKRLLLVDPQDFKLGTDYSIHFYRHSFKNERPDPEEDWATVFKQILERRRSVIEERKKGIHHSSRSLDKPFQFDDYTYTDNKMVRACSLSKMSHSSAGSAVAFRELPYSVEDSEEDDMDSSQNFMHSIPLNWQYSPDEVPPQITELNKRMSAIETLLGRLEEKITVPNQPLSLPEQAEPVHGELSPVDQEELELKKKLEELTENISDKGLSSDEEETNKLKDDIKPLGGSSHECSLITRRETTPVDKHSFSCDVQKKNLNSCELFQLESKVALTVASVQSTKSGVTDIQNRIAALGATGITEDKTCKKAPLASDRRMSNDFPFRVRHGTGSLRKLSII